MSIEATTFRPTSSEDVAWLGNEPIPAKPYYDPAYFELERRAVFMRTWLQIGHVCELPEPGCFIRRELEVARASILVIRGQDGAIRAFHNVCPHRGTQLVDEAEGKRARFSCRYHMWTFGTDGRLLSAPDFEQFNLSKAQCGLPELPTEVCAGLIFVNFDRHCRQGLREYLGTLAEELEGLPVARATTFSEYVYDVDANWKVVYDNFQENYHLRFIHTRTGGGGMGPANPFGYPTDFSFHGMHRKQGIWNDPAVMPHPVQGLAYMRVAAGVAAKGLLGGPNSRQYFALFPNFFILGSPVSHFSHTVYPITADRSRGVFRLYWVGEDGSASERFAREYLTASMRDLHSEDREVITAGQRGLSSGALEHIHFQTQEALCRHLYRCVDALVQRGVAG
jgi:phenylpropionate dioxygenase-like ring-hydroxylating dioxygenase large terminal subunit